MNETEQMSEHNAEQAPTIQASKRKRASRNGGENPRRTVDVVMGGSKGGIGKTLTAVMIAQFRRTYSDRVICLDTDPENWTFTEFDGLDVEHVDLLTRDDKSDDVRYTVNIDAMDKAMSRIIEEDADFVIDGGAGSFRPLMAYLLNGGLISLLANNKRVIVHGMLVGGGNLAETAEKLERMIMRFPAFVEKAVWLNPYFGPVSLNGVRFDESGLYNELSPHITSLIHMPDLDREAQGACLVRALDERLTFAEIESSQAWTTIAKWRARNIWDGFKSQMEAAL